MRRILAAISVYAIMLTGCARSGEQRGVVQLEAPRIRVHTYAGPEELRETIIAKGCTIAEPDGLDKGVREPLLVHGVGTVHWPSATIMIEEQRILINGVSVDACPAGYRNVMVERGGRVHPDSFIPFERPIYGLW